MRIFSFSPFGYEGSLVSVEVDLRRGIPCIDVVGLADGAVRESRERMRAAICNSNLEFPPERILISLSPADLRKEGAGFDLPIALAVLNAKHELGMSSVAEDEVGKKDSQSILVMGELELSGRIRPVRGVHAALATAAENGIKCCIVPKDNKMEALGLPNMKVFAAENLLEAMHTLEWINTNFVEAVQDLSAEDSEQENDIVKFSPVVPGFEFAEVMGQPFLVRGLQIAAAGGHNVFVYGPPGCGKTLALQKFPALLPLLTDEEARPVTRIYSVAGLMPPGEQLIKTAPFRVPHQSATIEGFAGGGINCSPGEISLAHNGVLFLDEAGEFRSSVLQCLRVPLESESITLSRAGRHSVYPASFQLLAAANPCPCGNYGSNDKICLCSIRTIEQYWKKFSAPLLDRIDIRLPLFNSQTEKDKSRISTEALRIDIERAIKIQRKFQKKRNARLTIEDMQKYCHLSYECKNYLEDATNEFNFSIRGVHSCIRIARTIADMDSHFENEKIERGNISVANLQEAVSFRKNEGGVNMRF